MDTKERNIVKERKYNKESINRDRVRFTKMLRKGKCKKRVKGKGEEGKVRRGKERKRRVKMKMLRSGNKIKRNRREMGKGEETKAGYKKV